MTSQSPRGRMIRQYFIAIEEGYREYLTDQIKNRLRIDDRDYYDKYSSEDQVKSYPYGPCVYVIKIIDDHHIRYRIGQTKNLNRRMNEHRREIPGSIELILFEMYENYDFLESCIHSFLKETQVTGINSYRNHEMTEIFESDIPKIIRIIDACKMFRQSSDVNSYIDEGESYSTLSEMFN